MMSWLMVQDARLSEWDLLEIGAGCLVDKLAVLRPFAFDSGNMVLDNVSHAMGHTYRVTSSSS
jgi:hypothetical protein